MCMIIKAEIEELKRRIKKSIDSPNKEQISILMKQAFNVCETLKAMLKTGSVEERLQITELTKEFRAFIAQESKRMADKAGMSQEAFVKKHEDPANFSKEQWNIMQNIRTAFAAQGKDIKGVLKEKKARKLPFEITRGAPKVASKSPRRVSKSKWLKT